MKKTVIVMKNFIRQHITGLVLLPAVLICLFFAEPLISGSNAYGAYAVCTPYRVASFNNRTHVLCNPCINGICYFAWPASDKAGAARFQGIVSAAYSLGRNVFIYYDPNDTSGSAYGCSASDCRVVYGVEY